MANRFTGIVSGTAASSFGAKQYGVLVKNVCKSYGEGPPVLSRFSLGVEKGTIYGLLGSSGCGKTTILSCIAGLRELNSGEIVVCGKKPRPGSHLGYMPQEIALYENMRIKEIMQYYGRIYGMRQEDILQRMQHLLSFLDLPDSRRIIATLSGGQQRRTSLALSLVHKPELLILDEPTVGVDPIVREKIWEHLLNLVAERKTTVIVTTHYIEEARSAHCVGLMRNGRLLCEKDPYVLLAEHNTELLEEIVLKLCRTDESLILPEEGGTHIPGSTTLGNNNDPVVGLTFKRRHSQQRGAVVAEYVPESEEEHTPVSSNMRDIIKALIIRNFIQLFRNYVFVLIVLGLPSAQVAMVYLIMGFDARYLGFGMVNWENPLNPGNDGSFCPQSAGCFTRGSGCKFVSILPKDVFIMKRFFSEEGALAAVQSGSIWGYLSIPVNYTKHLQDRALTKIFADNATINGSTISIRMDMSDYLVGSLMARQLLESYLRFLLQTASDCNQDNGLIELPFKYGKPVYGSMDTGYQEFLAPAILLAILYVVPLGYGGITYIRDRKQGCLERSMVAGVTNFEVIAASMVSEGIVILFQALMSYFIMTLVFGMEIKGSMILFLGLYCLTGISGLSLGFLIAMLVNEELEAIMISISIYSAIVTLSGSIWHQEGIADWVWFVSQAMPTTHGTVAIRSIVSRGWGITHGYVWPGFVVNIVWILGSCKLVGIVFKMRK